MNALVVQMFRFFTPRLPKCRRRRRSISAAAQRLEIRRLLSANPLGNAPASNQSVIIAVDATVNNHPIDPRIYGTAFATTQQLADLNSTVNREGGNTANTYNWQVDASNHANDWYFESIADGTGNGQSMDAFAANTKAGGAEPDLTIPIVPYVAKLGPNRSILGSYPVSVYHPQQSIDPFNSAFGNGMTPGNQNILDTNPMYNYVANSPAFEQGWIQHLLSTFGTPQNGGVQYFTLGNEPGLWNSTNRDIHPNGETNTELLNDIINYAGMIKSINPNAQILGPEEWGWTNYLIDGADAAAANWGATYDGLNAQQWLLKQLKQNQDQHGTRLIDFYTLHYYPQEAAGGPIFSDSVDQSTELLRNQVTRALWDPNYIDPSWINANVDLIPTMKNWVNTYYPGTKTGITEYNFGAEGDMNGATTQADLFGIFGQQGLDLATRWTTPATGSPAYLAMKLWRNYDGNDSGFGNTSVGASVGNPDQTDAFSAIRTSDGALTVAVINKNLYSASNPTATTSITVNLSGFAGNGTAQQWQLAAINPSDQTNAAIQHLSDVHFSGNSFTVNVPMESVTMFLIPPGSSLHVTTNPTNQTVNAGQTASFSAAATGIPLPTVQWQVSTNGGTTFTNIAAATSTTYSFTASAGQNGNEYRAVFTSGGVSANSTAATLTVHAPHIAVKYGATALINGTSKLNFDRSTTTGAVSKVITIANTGTAPLTVQPVTVPAGFSVVNNFTINQSIAVGTSASLTIQLNANAVGTPSGTVTIADNDASASPFAFMVTSSIDHAPIGTSGTVSGQRNTKYTLKTSDFGFTDPNDVPANTMLGVKLTLLPGAGTLTDNGSAVSVNQLISASDISGGMVAFTPNANLAGLYFLCKFQVQDDGGTANGGANLDPNAKILDITLNGGNHPPVGTAGTVTTNQNVSYVFKSTDFGFTDPNDSPPNTFLAVKLVLLPNAGTLTDNGAAITAGQSISAADIGSGKLVFKPTTNLTAGTYFLCKFQVQDNGGTANGGKDLDQNPKILQVRIVHP